MNKLMGMDIEFIEEKTAKIMKIDDITEYFDAYGETIVKETNTPAKHNVSEVGNLEQLSEEKMDLVRHIVAKLLYVSKRSRVDIDLEISFLCTRISYGTTQDWKKMRRLLNYLYETVNMSRIIGDNIRYVKNSRLNQQRD